MARAIWKGVIGFGDVSVPVKVYGAALDRTVHFRLLHEADHVPVQQRMVNPDSGEVVPTESVRRGYEVEDGRLVILEPDELASLAPEASRDIEVTRFVPEASIKHQWFDRPYWLGPDGEDEDYFALAAALAKAGRQGVARWTMRKKRYAGALRAEGDHLMLLTLRHAGEVVLASELEAPGGRTLAREEVRMAEKLVEALSGEFDPTEYRDEYRDRVLALIETKARGGKVELPAAPARPAERPLKHVLEESLKRARQDRGRRRRTA